MTHRLLAVAAHAANAAAAGLPHNDLEERWALVDCFEQARPARGIKARTCQMAMGLPSDHCRSAQSCGPCCRYGSMHSARHAARPTIVEGNAQQPGVGVHCHQRQPVALL